MSAVGPVIALGAIHVGTSVIIGKEPVADQGRPVASTIVLGAIITGIDRVSPAFAESLAWLCLVAGLFVPLGGGTSPVQKINKFFGY